MIPGQILQVLSISEGSVSQDYIGVQIYYINITFPERVIAEKIIPQKVIIIQNSPSQEYNIIYYIEHYSFIFYPFPLTMVLEVPKATQYEQLNSYESMKIKFSEKSSVCVLKLIMTVV